MILKVLELQVENLSGVFIVNFEYILHLVIMLQLMTINIYLPAERATESF